MSDLPDVTNNDTLDGAYTPTDPATIADATAYITRRLGDDAGDMLAALGLVAA